ncbi:MAG: flavodoxin [Blautia sp.]|nr:flavodoxin [Blautia sp.]
MRKIVRLFLSLTLAFGLCACGSGAGRQQDSSADALKQAKDSPAESESAETEAPAEEEVREGKTLVVYYSASGNTKRAAEYIAAAVNGDIFELVPQEPYSAEDLDWTDDGSRVVYEHDNPEARDIPLVETAVPGWESYDTVFIGFPIWWGIAAWPTDTFVKANDFTGKTVVPFCTSASSELGDSGTLLEEMAGTGDWLDGERFSSGVSENDVRNWLSGQNF